MLGDEKEESGWKMVAGDVFRAPPNGISLAVQVGCRWVANGLVCIARMQHWVTYGALVDRLLIVRLFGWLVS